METNIEPRPYQIYLYEKAVEQNTIIYLPTGAGKTYIAVLLIKRFSNSIIKPYQEDGKRTFFIVNTVALVEQQCKYISRHTPLVCKGYTGDMQVDFWSKNEWIKEIETNQVLVMTAQIFLNMLTNGIIKLNKVNLLIFDECHRAVGDHPMRLITQNFQYFPQCEQPRILALSGSLLNANIKLPKIDLTLKELEITFNAKIVTVESFNFVSDYSTNPIESLEYYDKMTTLEIYTVIENIIDNASRILNLIEIPNPMVNPETSKNFRPDEKTNKLKNKLMDVSEHLAEMGLYGGKKCVLLHIIQLQYIKKFTDDGQLILVLDFVITQLIKIQKLLCDGVMNLDLVHKDIIYRFSSPKIIKLIDVLKHFHNNLQTDQKFCCLIFVKRRFSAKVLYHILKELSECDQDLSFLRPDYIIGYNNNAYNNAREILCLSKWNKEALKKFRSGFSNCLVATDVIDEGIDVPLCSLVVRYYAPMDFRAYVQSKGRARHISSRYVILSLKGDDYDKRYLMYKQIEARLTKLHQADSRLQPTDDELNNILSDNVMEPFIINKKDGGKSILSETNAVLIVTMYCTNLYKSAFVTLSPKWVKKDISTSNLFQVELTLPPSSPLKSTIVGNLMPTIIKAKRSAALKACIELYKIGEINDNLRPKSTEDSLELAQHLFPYMEKEEIDADAIPGTNSKKRRHQRIYPEAFYGSFPSADEPLYLHIIQMKPNYPEPVNDNRHLAFYNLLNESNTYGILSRKPMPEIPAFPTFMNVGDLQVNVKINNKVNALTHPELISLRLFHTLLFNHILGVIKDFMLFDKQNKENCFLVVPVNESEQINWNVVNNYRTVSPKPPSKPLVVNDSIYKFALVTPNYRSSNVYIVTEVCEYLKAESKFPTPDFESYVHYFYDRHKLKIENPSQPMLEVKQISKRINCIKPRKAKANLSKRKRANIDEDFEEHLVPELCERIDFPSVYWLKATVLPSILHRICQLLVAEDLRVIIAQEAGLKIRTKESHYKWKPLRIENQTQQTTEIENSFEETLSDNEEIALDKSTDYDHILDVDMFSQEKKLYSWTKDQEPPDLERCADELQFIDIEYYYQFMANVTPEDQKNLKYQNVSKCHYLPALSVTVPPLKMLSETNPYGPSPVDIMQSLTAKCSNDSFNYERVETLGDSFLKFAISLFLFQAYPSFKEGQLTYLKGQLVGNLYLFYCAKQKNIAGRMNVEDFSPMTNFVTPAYAAERTLQKLIIESQTSANILYEIRIPNEERLSGSISENTIITIQDCLISWSAEPPTSTGMEHFLGIQIVSDKSVSDCVEAIIGTYLVHLGIKGALSITKWFEILPKDLDVEDFLHSKVPSPHIGTGSITELMPWADEIENRIKYKFRNRAFLLQALTHPSFTLNRQTGSYERLEFLGDAVLDFCLTVHIYETCGNLNPGELTDLRSALVNNITFACLAVRLGLHTVLLAYAPKLFTIVDRFVKFQEDRDHEINDELLWVLLEEEECKMAEHVDVPKVLGDIFESMIGAVFLDSGKDMALTWTIIYSIMKKEIDLFSKNVPKQPIRVMYETPGAEPKFSKAITVENTNILMVTLSIMASGKRLFFHGFGTTKKFAKCAACKLALKYLRYKP